MDVTATLGIVAGTMGTLLGLGLFFQAKKIFERKAADEISFITFGIFLLNNFAWVAYGAAKRDWPVVIPNIIATFGVLSILISAWYFNRKNQSSVD